MEKFTLLAKNLHCRWKWREGQISPLLQSSPISGHFHCASAMIFASLVLEKGLRILQDTPKQTFVFLRNFDEQTSLRVAICQGRILRKVIIHSGGDFENFDFNTLKHCVSDQLIFFMQMSWHRNISEKTSFFWNLWLSPRTSLDVVGSSANSQYLSKNTTF